MPVQRIICAALALTTAGCGVSQSRLDEAEALVREGLEAWKKGDKPADLRALARPVEFHEAMWNAGETLLSYETARAAYHDRAKVIRCEARLKVRNRRGKQKTETVVYDVDPGPPAKVVNNPM